jgi:hypothetical protein
VVNDDASGEANEFFEVTLGNPSGASLGSHATLRVDILDGAGVNQAPNAVAGSHQTVISGSTVTLSGGQSNDPDGDSLRYAWTQIMGPGVTLRDADSSTPSFTAPSVSSDTLLRFELQVTDPGGLSDSEIVAVTVSRGPATNGGTSGGGTLSLLLLGILSLVSAVKAATRRDRI